MTERLPDEVEVVINAADYIAGQSRARANGTTQTTKSIHDGIIQIRECFARVAELREQLRVCRENAHITASQNVELRKRLERVE